MKHIKLFEDYYGDHLPAKYEGIEIGDYVIIKTEMRVAANNKVSDFVDNEIGQLIDIYKMDSGYRISVKYENVPENIKSYFSEDSTRGFDISRIVDYAKTKEDLIPLIRGRKSGLLDAKIK